MSRLYGQGQMARELFVQLLREHGPLTNTEIAKRANTEADLWLFNWNVDPHMRRLEQAGRVERIQLAPRCTILWVAKAAA